MLRHLSQPEALSDSVASDRAGPRPAVISGTTPVLYVRAIDADTIIFFSEAVYATFVVFM
jgi:hypothetical protein